MVPRLPRPTLFPYTTLFRSYEDKMGRRGLRVADLLDAELMRTHIENACREKNTIVHALFNSACTMVFFSRQALDRKSTRLNSSHANSSYAVFCLKKKIE